jgi:histone-lysine N-methyltransferase SETMAR
MSFIFVSDFRGIRLLHYYASSCKAAIVREYLKQVKVVELLHPSFSPDLALCEFFLYPKYILLEENMKREKKIGGSAIFQCLNKLPRTDYENAFIIGLED